MITQWFSIVLLLFRHLWKHILFVEKTVERLLFPSKSVGRDVSRVKVSIVTFRFSSSVFRIAEIGKKNRLFTALMVSGPFWKFTTGNLEEMTIWFVILVLENLGSFIFCTNFYFLYIVHRFYQFYLFPLILVTVMKNWVQFHHYFLTIWKENIEQKRSYPLSLNLTPSLWSRDLVPFAEVWVFSFPSGYPKESTASALIYLLFRWQETFQDLNLHNIILKHTIKKKTISYMSVTEYLSFHPQEFALSCRTS